MDTTIPVSMPIEGGRRLPAPSFAASCPVIASMPLSSPAHIRPEAPGDAAFLDPILDAAFGPGRFAKSSERVRERARLAAQLSRIAVQDGAPIGCCRIFEIAIGAAPALFLGPLAVHPDAQAAGVGQALVADALAGVAQAHGAGRPVLVVGQPAFFARFGFVQVPDGQVIMPAPTEARRLQWLHGGPGVCGPVNSPLSAPHAAN